LESVEGGGPRAELLIRDGRERSRNGPIGGVHVAAARVEEQEARRDHALALVLPEVRDDPAVYPPDEVRDTLRKGYLHSPKEERMRSRLWSRVKTGL